MDLLAALLQGACYVAFAAALSPAAATRKGVGRTAVAIGLLTAVFGLVHGLLGPAQRELVCTHLFVAYEGSALEPSPVEFATDTVHAAGWLWPLPFAVFAGLWSVVAWRRPVLGNPWLLPLLLGWSAIATWLLMQMLAAPAAVVQPAALDRCLWPAGLALALRLAMTADRFLPLLLQLALGTTAMRLPAALFSKLASDRHLGTSLDVSKIVDIVHPVTRYQFEPRLEAGSPAQQFWLIWAEHVIAFPAFHMLSFSGIAFAVWLMRRHSTTPA